jgi:hypothetical protein
VRLRIDGIVGFGAVECQPQDPLRRIIDLQTGVGGISVGHELPFVAGGAIPRPRALFAHPVVDSFEQMLEFRFDRATPQAYSFAQIEGRKNNENAPLGVNDK